MADSAGHELSILHSGHRKPGAWIGPRASLGSRLRFPLGPSSVAPRGEAMHRPGRGGAHSQHHEDDPVVDERRTQKSARGRSTGNIRGQRVTAPVRALMPVVVKRPKQQKQRCESGPVTGWQPDRPFRHDRGKQRQWHPRGGPRRTGLGRDGRMQRAPSLPRVLPLAYCPERTALSAASLALAVAIAE